MLCFSAVESHLPSEWTANILVLDAATAKQVTHLLLATDAQHAKVLLNAFDPSLFPASFTEPAQRPRARVTTGTVNNDLMASSDMSLSLLIHCAVFTA
ncbi:hypothetical protein BCR37DRAFT_378295 [Protomyces lactucae-debilis]|uniref:Uncharacterized protein n=1 Tax=Protomyces lactucae-debilis TaxID=2754530 RepID=A0A1Y2FK17_PROLT|nr:uncharacterized protein BCR37DRAFT_378295 [Protomyces lactucae-debilis]ORY84290.1 hypothetical protein BCR37DRAFT_378295 [Protomyces lactucae-debilis]